MSLNAFLTKIWNKIKTLFDGVPSDIKAAVHISVIVTENLKTFVDSPAADIITALIPGNVDDQAKLLLRAKLPAILTALKLADNCSQQTDPTETTRCAIKVLQTMTGDVKSAFLHNIAVLLTKALAADKLNWSEGVIISEWYYQNNRNTWV